jgi:hypothetical protein
LKFNKKETKLLQPVINKCPFACENLVQKDHTNIFLEKVIPDTQTKNMIIKYIIPDITFVFNANVIIDAL